MIKLKDLLKEGQSKNPLINRLLVELKPLIADIIESTKQRYKKEEIKYGQSIIIITVLKNEANTSLHIVSRFCVLI